jgi:hypothetical protein
LLQNEIEAGNEPPYLLPGGFAPGHRIGARNCSSMGPTSKVASAWPKGLIRGTNAAVSALPAARPAKALATVKPPSFKIERREIRSIAMSFCLTLI